MQEKISSDEWSQWVGSPVTQAVLNHLKEAQNNYIEQMLNLDVTDTTESYALKSLSLRYAVEGIAQFTDLESLKLDIIQEEDDERDRA